MTDQSDVNLIFAVDLATLAREIAMDVLEIPQLLQLHQLTNEEWLRIQENPKFIDMVATLSAEWQAASNTRERVKMKAATGLESQLSVYIRDLGRDDIPLAQRVEAGRFLARLGELDGDKSVLGSGGSGVTINISTSAEMPPLTIEATSSPSPRLVGAGVLPDEDESA